MVGILQVRRERLKMVVRKEMPFGPRPLRYRFDRLSGPTAFEFLEVRLASATSLQVILGASERGYLVTLL